MLPQISHILHFCLVDSLLRYATRFCSQMEWCNFLTVWWPQFCRDESIAVSFSGLLHMASLQTKIAVYGVHSERSVSVSIWRVKRCMGLCLHCLAFLVECQLLRVFFSVCSVRYATAVFLVDVSCFWSLLSNYIQSSICPFLHENSAGSLQCMNHRVWNA